MSTPSRLAFAAKGAVLWVLIAVLLGILVALLTPNDVSSGMVWVGAGMGVIGALSHAFVCLLKRPPYNLAGTATMVWVLSSALTLVLAYWIVGLPTLRPPSAAVEESLRAAATVLLPMAGVSALVVYLLRGKSAA
jgi:hypothetical protein